MPFVRLDPKTMEELGPFDSLQQSAAQVPSTPHQESGILENILGTVGRGAARAGAAALGTPVDVLQTIGLFIPQSTKPQGKPMQIDPENKLGLRDLKIKGGEIKKLLPPEGPTIGSSEYIFDQLY